MFIFQRPKSSSWKELSSFAFEDVKDPTGDNSKKWSQPFPIDIPSFPVLSGEDPNGSRYQSSATFKDSFVPSHLPPYPPAHTYKRGTSSSKKRGLDQSVVQNGGQRDGKNTRKKKIDAVKSAEQSLSMIEDSVDATINKAK